MEITALFILIIIEIGLAIICVKSRSHCIKTRSIIRLILAGLFIVLLAFMIIKWDSRWYAIALVMAIITVTSLFRIISHKVIPKEFNLRRAITNLFVMILLWIMAFSPAIIFPQHQPLVPSGKFSIKTSTYTFTDQNRIESYSKDFVKRKVTVQFWYPTEVDGKYPLIIFSHGSFGVVTSNISLYSDLASHGYVVGSVSHTYQSLYTTDADGQITFLDQGFMREVSIEDAKNDKQQSYEFYKKWMGIRMGDINFVINTILDQINNPDHDQLFELIDQSKIGVMGHSLGGSAALGIGEIRKDVSAVIALESPFMFDIIGVKNGTFIWNEKPYPLPVLNIYSENSWSHLNDWPQYAANARLLYEEQPDIFNVYLKGAVHLSLTDLALTSPFLTRILSGQNNSLNSRDGLIMINQIALGFFNDYLKDQGDFSFKEVY